MLIVTSLFWSSDAWTRLEVLKQKLHSQICLHIKFSDVILLNRAVCVRLKLNEIQNAVLSKQTKGQVFKNIPFSNWSRLIECVFFLFSEMLWTEAVQERAEVREADPVKPKVSGILKKILWTPKSSNYWKGKQWWKKFISNTK